ncbi:hypothetical protein FQN50_007549 [Emmonsiellopsis sp. PD_5]|nr:hypothetical protein FQN50_007549 [Emmonsiellopsis sp. PD_5]
MLGCVWTDLSTILAKKVAGRVGRRSQARSLKWGDDNDRKQLRSRVRGPVVWIRRDSKVREETKVRSDGEAGSRCDNNFEGSDQLSRNALSKGKQLISGGGQSLNTTEEEDDAIGDDWEIAQGETRDKTRWGMGDGGQMGLWLAAWTGKTSWGSGAMRQER